MVVNGAGDQLLAGARFSPDQNCGTGPRHPGHLLAHLPHGAAGTDQAGEVVPPVELLTQLRVLADQLVTLGLEQTMNAYRLRDHRGDDPEKFEQAAVLPFRLVRQFDRERAYRPPMEKDGNAHEAELGSVPLLAGCCAVKKAWVSADLRHHDRLAALRHCAGNALPQGIAGGAPG